MLDRCFAFLTPQGWVDAAMKMAALLCIIIISNIVFAEIYLGYQPVGIGYFVTNACFVGSPLLACFFIAGLRRQKAELLLRYRSRTDDLTGMHNRRTFMEETSALLDRNANGVLMMLDADHFKKINDSHGHAVGDQCLMAIADRIAAHLGPEDVAGRIGGEEFAIFLPQANCDQAEVIAASLVAPISVDGPPGEASPTVTVSVGGAAISKDRSLDEVLRSADASMYAAKKAGRARAVICRANAAPPDGRLDGQTDLLAS